MKRLHWITGTLITLCSGFVVLCSTIIQIPISDGKKALFDKIQNEQKEVAKKERKNAEHVQSEEFFIEKLNKTLQRCTPPIKVERVKKTQDYIGKYTKDTYRVVYDDAGNVYMQFTKKHIGKKNDPTIYIIERWQAFCLNAPVLNKDKKLNRIGLCALKAASILLFSNLNTTHAYINAGVLQEVPGKRGPAAVITKPNNKKKINRIEAVLKMYGPTRFMDPHKLTWGKNGIGAKIEINDLSKELILSTSVGRMKWIAGGPKPLTDIEKVLVLKELRGKYSPLLEIEAIMSPLGRRFLEQLQQTPQVSRRKLYDLQSRLDEYWSMQDTLAKLPEEIFWISILYLLLGIILPIVAMPTLHMIAFSQYRKLRGLTEQANIIAIKQTNQNMARWSLKFFFPLIHYCLNQLLFLKRINLSIDSIKDEIEKTKNREKKKIKEEQRKLEDEREELRRTLKSFGKEMPETVEAAKSLLKQLRLEEAQKKKESSRLQSAKDKVRGWLSDAESYLWDDAHDLIREISNLRKSLDQEAAPISHQKEVAKQILNDARIGNMLYRLAKAKSEHKKGDDSWKKIDQLEQKVQNNPPSNALEKEVSALVGK